MLFDLARKRGHPSAAVVGPLGRPVPWAKRADDPEGVAYGDVAIASGKVAILDYVAVHDAGTVVNPMTLAGHIRGGTAQGIGTALYEKFHYDENGQLVTGTFADYLIPTLAEMPPAIRVGHVETPSPFTEYGIKGGGEGGRHRLPEGALGGVRAGVPGQCPGGPVDRPGGRRARRQAA